MGNPGGDVTNNGMADAISIGNRVVTRRWGGGSPQATRRLDAVALILFAAGTALAVCVGTYRPLTGLRNPLGPAGDDLAGWLVDALGVGATVLLVGWFALAALYAARRSWSRLLVR